MRNNENIIPELHQGELCEAWKLCSVREKQGEYMVAVKRLEGAMTEVKLDQLINAKKYEGISIVRTYSSGHVFVDDSKTKVYLVTTEKHGKRQHQFTGGSPLEKNNFNVIFRGEDGKIKLNISKIEENALIRTQNRTGAVVTSNYNELPLVDWILMEQENENGKYWKMVLLIHFVVKTYDGELGFNKGVEDVISGDWFYIADLDTTSNVAPNASIVTKKAVEVFL